MCNASTFVPIYVHCLVDYLCLFSYLYAKSGLSANECKICSFYHKHICDHEISHTCAWMCPNVSHMRLVYQTTGIAGGNKPRVHGQTYGLQIPEGRTGAFFCN